MEGSPPMEKWYPMVHGCFINIFPVFKRRLVRRTITLVYMCVLSDVRMDRCMANTTADIWAKVDFLRS